MLEAEDGAEALAVARRETPDLIVSDVMMPALDGVGLVRALRADAATDFIPVVLLTAKAEEADVQHGLDAGADDYVVKPFNVQTLEARIENLIASRRWLRARFATSPSGSAGTAAGDGPPAAPTRPRPQTAAPRFSRPHTQPSTHGSATRTSPSRRSPTTSAPRAARCTAASRPTPT